MVSNSPLAWASKVDTWASIDPSESGEHQNMPTPIVTVVADARFRISPIDPAVADDLRASAGALYVADEDTGYPCRQCLQDAAIGDELVLVSYDPFSGESPYRSASPIFLHRQSCLP